MNIYHIQWDSSGFGMNAVAIAEDEKSALLQVFFDFQLQDANELSVQVIGVCVDGVDGPRLVCEEAL